MEASQISYKHCTSCVVYNSIIKVDRTIAKVSSGGAHSPQPYAYSHVHADQVVVYIHTRGCTYTPGGVLIYHGVYLYTSGCTYIPWGVLIYQEVYNNEAKSKKYKPTNSEQHPTIVLLK